MNGFGLAWDRFKLGGCYFVFLCFFWLSLLSLGKVM